MFSAPPTAYDGVLYASGAGGGGTLFALSEATGALTWSAAVMNGDVSSPTVNDSGVYEDYACDLSYGFSLNGTNRWTDTFGCEGGGGATTVLNGSHLYLRGGNQGPGALIVSPATGASSGTFGGTGLPAFDATNMYVVSGGALHAVDKSGSPAHWSFAGDGTIDTTPVTTNGIVFTGSSSSRLYGINSSTGAQVWTAFAPGAVSTYDGFGMHTGLAAADGFLAVPAAGFLTVYTN
jgi:eukaryotic-like serine/threonine-protein kinase